MGGISSLILFLSLKSSQGCLQEKWKDENRLDKHHEMHHSQKADEDTFYSWKCLKDT